MRFKAPHIYRADLFPPPSEILRSRPPRAADGVIYRWSDVDTAVRTTGLLTAGRNPRDRTDPVCRTVARPAPLPHQCREVFGDVHRCSRQPEDAGLGHELTLLSRVGFLGRIRPAGRDGGRSGGTARESCPGETRWAMVWTCLLSDIFNHPMFSWFSPGFQHCPCIVQSSVAV